MTGQGNEPFDWRAAAATSVGCVRDLNEDSYLMNVSAGIFIVADGLGGHAAGEIASRIAIEQIGARLSDPVDQILFHPLSTLLASIHAAHQAIRQVASQSPNLAGMGTTVVVGWFPPNSAKVWLANVGDSRFYLHRDHRLIQLSEDHTVLNQVRKAASSTPADVAQVSAKSMLSQALGSSEFIAPAVQSLDVSPGDHLLLCSDGLTDMLEDCEILHVMDVPQTAQSIVDMLVFEAQKKGGNDNCTAIVVDIVADRTNTTESE